MERKPEHLKEHYENTIRRVIESLEGSFTAEEVFLDDRVKLTREWTEAVLEYAAGQERYGLENSGQEYRLEE